MASSTNIWTGSAVCAVNIYEEGYEGVPKWKARSPNESSHQLYYHSFNIYAGLITTKGLSVSVCAT